MAPGQGGVGPIGGGGGGGGVVAQGTVLTRTLYVNISGSLGALEMAGPSAGSWKLVDGRSISVFGMGSDVDAQVRHLCPCCVRRGLSNRLCVAGGT
jgi:hypothetical protein